MKTILFLILFNLTGICLGQTVTDSIAPKNIILGTRIGVNPSFVTGGLNYYADFTIEKRKSYAAIGPIAGKTVKMDYWYDRGRSIKKYSLNGFHLVYQINPNPKAKRFDFYFQYEFIFLYYIDKGTTENMYKYSSQYYPLTLSYKSHQSEIENTIGYGFKFKFFKNFYLNQNIGIGIAYNAISINYGDYRFNSSRHYYELIPGLNIGVGYKFDKKLKKPRQQIDNVE